MEAYLYEPLKNNEVKCNLCHHRCVIRDGKRGICTVRENSNGVLQTLVFGRVIAEHVDPIEKKPLFQFLPGTLSYSVATAGCNFQCKFCQNASIAQLPRDHGGIISGDYRTPEAVVDAAQKSGAKSIAYTYTEPTVYFEFAYETARLAHERNLKNVFVTNGYMTPEALEMISPYLDAANVDLKAFSEEFYLKLCSARMDPVLRSLIKMKELGIFIEITTLIIPGWNDDLSELKQLAGFISQKLGPETPWHISRFHPTYKLTDRSSTPVSTLKSAREIGIDAGLKYVYTGNVPGDNGEHTHCPSCGKTVIERWGFSIRGYNIKNGECVYCNADIHGVGL